MDSAKIEAILEELCQNIGGEWLLLGGSLVQIEYDGGRATEDIDLVGINPPAEKSEIAAQDELFQAAYRLGLDPDGVNSAARFFVNRLSGWRDQLRLLRSGDAGKIYAPTLALFVATKLGRASETDLGDVRAAIAHEGAESFDENAFATLVKTEPAILANFSRHRAALGLPPKS